MNRTDVAIVGAGPYGLSLAAHLRARGADYRQFGIPMRLWQASMPKGMFLKSQGFASSFSDPDGTHTLESFCAATGRAYEPCGDPVALSTFVSYGQWFQSDLGLEVDESLVVRLTKTGDGFVLELGNGAEVLARRVVVAVGVEHFAYTPAPLAELPAGLCTHSSRHADPAAFRGREVVVVGAGQSALELAGLMHENGATVQILARRDVVWNGTPGCPPRPLLERLKAPQNGLGEGWKIWACANLPGVYRRLPRDTRIAKARSVLGPAGANWLRDRVDGRVPVLTRRTVAEAKALDGRVRLGVTEPGGTSVQLEADHVIAATGYRVDLGRLTFLAAGLRSGLRTVGGSPAVGRDFQSSVTGLYFMGPAVAPTFGPVTRFVYGSRHAATTVARQLAGRSASGSRRMLAPAG